MIRVRAMILGAVLVSPTGLLAQSAATGAKSPLFPVQHDPMPMKNPLTKVPGVEPVPPMPKKSDVWRPENETKDEPHLQLIPDWYPSPPPANYTTSSCNFNVWCGEERFSPDFSTYQVLLGGSTTIPSIGPRVPDFTSIPLSFRCGWMLNAPHDTDAFYRGNYEVLLDFTLAGVTSGIGHAWGGSTLIGRYNFVQPGASLVPYVQVGGGFMLTDAYKNRQQRGIGQGFEFHFRAEVGVRCFISDNWSVDIEGGVQHISNGRMADRNYGVNPVGGQIGFTYFFPSGGR